MQKNEEITNPQSCLNRAGEDEMLFVLRGHDIAAPAAIRRWCEVRIRMGKNKPGDDQIKEAMECARAMERGFEATVAAVAASTEP